MSKLACATAMALGLISMPALAADDQGFYAGAGAGQVNVDFGGDFDGVSLSFDDGDTAFRVFGGWQFNDNVGMEAGYVDGGTASETFDVDGTDVDLDIGVFHKSSPKDVFKSFVKRFSDAKRVYEVD